jgi:hypothetical protein
VAMGRRKGDRGRAMVASRIEELEVDDRKVVMPRGDH